MTGKKSIRLIPLQKTSNFYMVLYGVIEDDFLIFKGLFNDPNRFFIWFTSRYLQYNL